jgi:peptidyl-prolyl cis-trans isomerase-like 4
LFNKVQRNFIAQSGSIDCRNNIETSIFGIVYGEQNLFYDDETNSKLRHNSCGIVSMASNSKNLNGSAFYITLPEIPLESLDNKHTVFGQVTEGLDTLERINAVAIDGDCNPLQKITLIRTIIIHDPFVDLPGQVQYLNKTNLVNLNDRENRIEEKWSPGNNTSFSNKKIDKLRQKETESKKILLEMIGDLPTAEAKPPNNVIFVCKLNPLTSEEDLELIFSQCGKVTSCEIVRDPISGESLNYCFISFEGAAACELAFFKMNNVIIDHRRVKVDFSQSVANIWKQIKRQQKSKNQS